VSSPCSFLHERALGQAVADVPADEEDVGQGRAAVVGHGDDELRVARAVAAPADRRRDLDELKLEYKGKEERFVLDGDRKALGDIKAELDALRRRHVADEDRAKVAKNAAMEAVHYAMQNAPASPRGGPRPAPRHQSPRAVFDDACATCRSSCFFRPMSTGSAWTSRMRSYLP